MLKNWKNDFLSSVVVFLVALPLCLGIALASNAPLSAGLFAGIIGGVVVGALSGSHVSVSGPAAGLTVIVVNGLAQLGSFEAFTLAVFLAGVFQFLFGLMKAGVIGNYFPTAVIKGMLAAIGLILITKQIPNVLGLPANWDFSHLLELMNSGILIISFSSVAIMLFWEKMSTRGLSFFKLVPGALVAVLFSISLEFLYMAIFPGLNLDPSSLVHLPFHGGFQEIWSMVNFPSMERITDTAVIQVALTIAVVGSIETLLSVDAAEKIDPQKRPTSRNRELFAQGAGNMLSGFFGGLPITAVIVRTSANISAGSKTKLSAILHGLWILACIDLIPDLLNFIPLASLACILLLTGYKLCKPYHFLEMSKRGVDQLVIFCSTIIAILATDLLKGIFVGILVALLFEIKKIKRRPFKVFTDEQKCEVEFLEYVSFLHKAELQKVLNEIPSGKKLILKNMNGIKLHIDVQELILEKKRQLDKIDNIVTIT